MNIQNPGIKNGLIAGLFIIAAKLLAYLINPPMYFSPTITFGLGVVYIVFMVLAGREARTANGGHITWRQVLTPVFLTGALASLLVTIFQVLLFNVIDPGMIEVQKEVALEGMAAYGEFLGDEFLDTYAEQMENYTYSLFTGLSEWAFSCVYGFIPAAIIAAFLQKKAPENIA